VAVNPASYSEDLFSEDLLESSGYRRLEGSDLTKEFGQKRVQIRNLQKVYSLCSMHSQKARSLSKHLRAQNFDNERRNAEFKLDKLKEECIFIAFEFCKRSGFRKLDLHGLYLEEAEEVVMLVLNKIMQIQRSDKRMHRSVRYFGILT